MKSSRFQIHPLQRVTTHTFHRSIRLTYERIGDKKKQTQRVSRNGKRKTICTFNPPFRPFKPLVNGKGTTDTFSLRGFRHQMAFNGGVQVAEPRFSMIHRSVQEISVRFTTRRPCKSFELKRGVSLKIAGKYRAVELGRREISVNGNGLKQEGPLLLGKVKKIQPLNHLRAFLLCLFDVSFFFFFFFASHPWR